MLIDETPRSFVKKNNSYSHCPLKKRPVTVLLSEEILPKTEIKEELIDVVVSDESSEPENLSTKPEDLSKNSGEKRQRSRSPSPLPAKIRRVSPIPTSPIVPQPPTTLPTLHHQIHHHHHHQQQQQHQQYQPLFPSKALTPPVGIAPVVHPVARKARIEILQHDSTSAAVGQMHFLSNNLVSNPEAASYWARHSAAAAALYPTATISPNAASPPSHHHQHYLPAAYQQQHYQQDMYPAYPVPGYPHHSTSPELPRPIPHWPTTAGSPPVATSPEDLSNSPSSDSGRSSAGSTSAGSVHSHHHHQEKSPNHHQAPRYQCPDCNKSYSTYSGLSKHQQFHCAAAEGQPKKTFSCKFCDKLYLTLGALKMHIRTHTLPCKCHLCGKAFSRPWLLQGHIRTHTGEKPFSCQHCNRAFADRSNLRAHLQTHSDVKKYSCAQCSKTFSRMSLLGKHQEAGCPGVNPQIVQQPQVPLGYAC